MKRPGRALMGEVVAFRWRDSHQGDFEQNVDDIPADVVWTAVGEVVRVDPVFLTISYGRQVEPSGNEKNVHSPLSVPWTQIEGLTVLVPE